MIPLTIVSGFLGVGKTTLIDHFIYSNNDNKPSRLAVIVNDLSRFNADVEIMKSNYLRDSSNSASNEDSAIENNNDNDGADNKSTSIKYPSSRTSWDLTTISSPLLSKNFLVTSGPKLWPTPRFDGLLPGNG